MTAPYLKFTNFKIPNKLWRCVGGRVKDEDFIGFIKRANKGQISTVKDLESWCFERQPFCHSHNSTKTFSNKRSASAG